MSVKYLYSVARVRYKETTLMDDAAMRQLLAQKSKAQVLSLLTQRGWETSGGAAKMIALEREKLHAEINELAENDPAVRVFYARNDFHNLKAAIKLSYASQKNVSVYLPGELDISSLHTAAASHDYSALPEYMRGAAEAADSFIGKFRDPFLSDSVIDKAAVEYVFEQAKKSGSVVAQLYARNMLLKAAIKTALRTAGSRTKKQNAELIAGLGLIEPDALVECAEKGMDEVISYLEKQGCHDAARACKVGAARFEDELDNSLVRSLRAQKYITSSIDPILAYMLAKENEIKNVFLVTRAISGGIEPAILIERMRESYV